MSDPPEEARRWLVAAREELDYARHAARGGYHAPACFHAQQAAEKAVKALHFLQGARAVLGHNIRALIDELDPQIDALAELGDAARELDLLYVPTRYPNSLETGTPAQAFSGPQSKRALAQASRIVKAAAQAVSE